MTDKLHATLSDEEIATLNAARSTLDAIASRALYGTPGVTSSQADGMIHARADAAADAIFKLLNIANTWWSVPMTHAQLHNREPVEVES